MKKFLVWVIVVVGLGLALRFTLNDRDQESPAPAPLPPVPQPRPQPEPEAHESGSTRERDLDRPPEHAPPPATPSPAPPRIAGSKQVSDAVTRHFAAAGGVVYYCSGGSVIAASATSGSDAARAVGSCESAFDFVADTRGVFYCEDATLYRITPGTTGSHPVTTGLECITSALDAKYVYFVVPGFDGVENPGVYRVARTGGTPERIHATRPKEQFMLAVDDDALWIGAWSAGTISRLPKRPGAKATTVVTGQKGIVDLATDGTSLYWHVESSGEVRRRKKTGKQIDVIGRDVVQEQILVVDGHAYWVEGGGDQDARLMHLAPGATEATVLASGLSSPSLAADSKGVYVSELDREGIFMLPR